MPYMDEWMNGSRNIIYNLEDLNNYNNTYLYSALFTLCSHALLKNTVIPLLNTHRSYTEKMKVFNSFFNIVMESALFCTS